MPDNVTLNSGSGGADIAADNIDAVHYQRVKLIHGPDGVNKGDVAPSNGLPVELSGSNIVNPQTYAVKTVTYGHHEIHEGRHFHIEYMSTGSHADGSNVEIRIQTPATPRWAHMIFSAESVGESELRVYSDTAKTNVVANGLTGSNSNNNSVLTSTCTPICHTPAGAGSDGTLKFGPVRIGAGKQVGGDADREKELVLKQDCAYLFQHKSKAAANKMGMRFEWYEHINK